MFGMFIVGYIIACLYDVMAGKPLTRQQLIWNVIGVAVVQFFLIMIFGPKAFGF